MSLQVSKPILNPSFRQRIGYHSGLLGGMAMIISILLIVGHGMTHKDIELRLQEDRIASLNEVLPPALYDNNPLEQTMLIEKNPFNGSSTMFIATMNGQFSGAAFEVVGSGYSGDIVLLLGVDSEGTVTGVRTLSHAETPGLGDKIEIKKHAWITSFDGKSLINQSPEQWQVKKDGGEYDQFTGATITPRAVVTAVYQGLQLYKRLQPDIQDRVNILLKESQSHE